MLTFLLIQGAALAVVFGELFLQAIAHYFEGNAVSSDGQRFATHVDATRRVDPGGTLRNTTVCQTYVVEVRALWYAMACVSARRATKLLMRAYQNHALSTANVSIGGTVETTARRVLKSKVEPKLSCDARDLETN